MTPTRWRWNSGSVTDARAWSAVLGTLLSLLLGVFYLAARTAFDNPVRPVAALLGLGLWFIAFPLVLHLALRRDEKTYSWLASESFLTLAVLALTGLAGWLAPRAGVTLSPLFGTIGAGASVWLLVRQLRSGSARSTGWFLAGAVLFSIWTAGVVWANGFLSPLILENLILRGGTSHVDTWYLGSLANMLQLHGYPSVGLDGVPPLTYHYGSSLFFAQLAELTGVSVLDFYQIGFPLVIVPLFVRGIFTCAHDAYAWRIQLPVFSLYNSPLVWVILGAATIGALPPAVLHAAGVWASGPILSESYTLVIPLCLLLAGAAASFWRDKTMRSDGGLQNSFGTAGFYLLFVPLAVGAIGVVKVSQMILLMVVIGWVFLRLSLWREPFAVISVAVTALTALLVYQHVVGAGRSGGIMPLAFLRLLPASTWIFFPVLHLFWSWVYVLLRLRAEGVRSARGIGTALRSGKIVDVEIVAVIAIAGQIPGNVFEIPNANAYYFTDFQRWVSLALLLGAAPVLTTLNGWASRLRRSDSRLSPVARNLVTLALLPFGLTMVFTSLAWGTRLIKDNLSTRREIQRVAQTLPDRGLLSGIRQIAGSALKGRPVEGVRAFEEQLHPLADRTKFEQVLRSSPRYPIVSALEAASRLPRAMREESVLFVQPDVGLFWGMLPQAECIYSPFVGPALAAIPLLGGIPPRCKFQSFVLGHERPELGEWATPSTASDAEVCARAEKKGFRRVIRLAPAPADQVTMRSIRCNGGA